MGDLPGKRNDFADEAVGSISFNLITGFFSSVLPASSRVGVFHDQMA